MLLNDSVFEELLCVILLIAKLLSVNLLMVCASTLCDE